MLVEQDSPDRTLCCDGELLTVIAKARLILNLQPKAEGVPRHWVPLNWYEIRRGKRPAIRAAV